MGGACPSGRIKDESARTWSRSQGRGPRPTSLSDERHAVDCLRSPRSGRGDSRSRRPSLPDLARPAHRCPRDSRTLPPHRRPSGRDRRVGLRRPLTLAGKPPPPRRCARGSRGRGIESPATDSVRSGMIPRSSSAISRTDRPGPLATGGTTRRILVLFPSFPSAHQATPIAARESHLVELGKPSPDSQVESEDQPLGAKRQREALIRKDRVEWRTQSIRCARGK
jgi:hypothetical protein